MCGLLFFTALPFIAASMITFAIVVPLDRFATQSNQRSSKKATTLPADDKDGPGRDAEVDGYGALLPYRTEQSEKRHHRAAVEQKQWLQGRALKLRSPLVQHEFVRAECLVFLKGPVGFIDFIGHVLCSAISPSYAGHPGGSDHNAAVESSNLRRTGSLQ